jgi:penicillin amidase
MRSALRLPGFAATPGAHRSAARTSSPASPPDTTRLAISGVRAPVRIVRDRFGVSHIYAQNEHDLFFAQGWSAARDRLFQFELWRRRASGTLAEVLGSREVARDRAARLFRYRGDLDSELVNYHPRGPAILRAFVAGVNARVEEVLAHPDSLPPEFRWLGWKPGRWTVRDVISRHGALLGDLHAELDYGRAVAVAGPATVERLGTFGPGTPDLALDSAIDGKALLDPHILDPYDAWRSGVDFRPSDLAIPYRASGRAYRQLAEEARLASLITARHGRQDIGSNNWVVAGGRTLEGRPFMANDPHRRQAAPSLRYFVHLVAPGWDVIGGGEPEAPGVSIGHNRAGAWGLTVFATDNQDLYVYRTDPADPDRYRYRGAWEAMQVEHDTIRVKGSAPVPVTLRYTRHGPVVYRDTARHLAYAIRAAWLEPGGAQYLATLRLDQASTWEEARQALSHHNVPGENYVWADTAGHIGWQAVGIAPIRKNWSGLVPVPGDGRYEWAGFLPILEKPHVTDPPKGFWATANNMLIPPGYPHRDAVGWLWTDPYRAAREAEVLGSGRRLSMRDMMRLQMDYTSIPARTLVPLLAHLRAGDPRVESARRRLLAWDDVLTPESVAAGIFVAWERRFMDAARDDFVPESIRAYLPELAMSKVSSWLLAPDGRFDRFGPNPVAGRDAFLLAALRGAVQDLTRKLGADEQGWRLGQASYKHATLLHPLSAAVSDSLRALIDVGPAPRGGDSYVLNNTGWGDNQTSGPSFRVLVEVGAWDRSLATNTPGQSGDPRNPHYRDLFPLWATNRYFPLLFSSGAVAGVAESVELLRPE